MTRCGVSVLNSGERLVDWRGQVSAIGLMRETLRTMGRKALMCVLSPGLVLLGCSGVLASATDLALERWTIALSAAGLVALWGTIAQAVAGTRTLHRLVASSLVGFFVVLGAVFISQRFEWGLAPFVALMALLGMFPVAVPAVAVDGLWAGGRLRDRCSEVQGSRLRLWGGWAMFVAATSVLSWAASKVFVRHPVEAWVEVATACVIVGTGVGAVMTLSSLAYVQLENLRRASDVSSWVEVFR